MSDTMKKLGKMGKGGALKNAIGAMFGKGGPSAAEVAAAKAAAGKGAPGAGPGGLPPGFPGLGGPGGLPPGLSGFGKKK